MSLPETLDDAWLNLTAAAKELGLSRLKVSGIAIAGELETHSIGGMTFISQKSIDAYKAKLKKKASKK